MENKLLGFLLLFVRSYTAVGQCIKAFQSRCEVQLKFTASIFTILFLIFSWNVQSQCSPSFAENCEDSHVFCSLSELNGYCCQNPDYPNPTGCTPLCPSGGTSSNTGWWAFVSQGGSVSITITFNNCSVNGQGLKMGIWDACDCSENLVCNPGCNGPNNYTLSANVSSCKTYYFFIDGCNGDVCDFCLTTSGGAPPNIPPISSIGGLRDVCIEACNVRYTAILGGFCEPIYEWTLDGNPVGSESGDLILDFPVEGDFVLCVTAYIGNPQSGSICDQEGPKCITIKARPIPDKVGPPWILCLEALPFRWHAQTVDGPGIYHQTFGDPNSCCKFDSIREFIILDVPEMPEVFYLGCNELDAYIDPTTRQSFNNCQYNRPILLKKSTMPYRCDSSYLLNAVFLDHQVTFREYCDSGKLYLEPRIIDRTNTCDFNNQLSQDYSYRWYIKSDSTKKTIDSVERIELTKKEEYCLEVFVNASYEKISKKCSFIFCEQWDESNFFPYEVCIAGNFDVKPGDSALYGIDTILKPTVTSQTWSVTGGRILTRDGGKDTSDVWILWDDTSFIKTICYQYSNDCGISKKCCKDIRFTSKVGDFFIKPEDIRIIPNPVNQKFNIQTAIEIKILSLYLYDQMGRSVTQWKKPVTLEFDISTSPDGMYYLVIQTDRGMLNKKIILLK
ncbi:MAG: T9SS type A sorting domain-containing protein [Saprospiraceae bacterium]|nr:T9SS type A sorting domain-containing protein [Saprospiraceae bacterium]